VNAGREITDVLFSFLIYNISLILFLVSETKCELPAVESRAAGRRPIKRKKVFDPSDYEKTVVKRNKGKEIKL